MPRKTTTSATPASATPAAEPATVTALRPRRTRKPAGTSGPLQSVGDAARLEEIRTRAYLIWLDEGQPDGRDQEHWLRAEREVGATLVHSAMPLAVQAAE